MPGRVKAHAHAVDRERLAVRHGFDHGLAAEPGARERSARGRNPRHAVAGQQVIRVGVRDERACDGLAGIDMKNRRRGKRVRRCRLRARLDDRRSRRVSRPASEVLQDLVLLALLGFGDRLVEHVFTLQLAVDVRDSTGSRRSRCDGPATPLRTRCARIAACAD